MVDAERLKASLRLHEGDKAKLYDDATGKELRPGDRLAGFLTGGVGHNFSAKGLSPAAREFILNEDILDAKRFLEREMPWALALDDVRARFFIEMAFNMEAKLLGFVKANRHAKAREWDLAADAYLDSLWARQVGKRAVTLTEMLRTGKDPVHA
jgi:lysozyme